MINPPQLTNILPHQCSSIKYYSSSTIHSLPNSFTFFLLHTRLSLGSLSFLSTSWSIHALVHTNIFPTSWATNRSLLNCYLSCIFTYWTSLMWDIRHGYPVCMSTGRLLVFQSSFYYLTLLLLRCNLRYKLAGLAAFTFRSLFINIMFNQVIVTSRLHLFPLNILWWAYFLELQL